jgi:hypothetical protein
MTETDYRHALILLDTALTLFERRRDRPEILRRRLRALSLELDLLRAGLRQSRVSLRRN